MANEMKFKIALIEDNPDLCALLVEEFSNKNFFITGFLTAEQFLSTDGQHDAIIIDINLPGMNGVDLLKHVRESDNEVGIIMLSVRFDAETRIKCLNEGADIFLQKPCRISELSAVLHRMAQRTRPREHISLSMEGGDILDLDSLTLHGAIECVSLTQQEAEVLAELARTPNKQVTSDRCRTLFFGDKKIGSGALEMRITRLRKKVARVTGKERSIVSVHNHGYKLLLNLKVKP